MSQLPAIQVQRSLFPATAEWTMIKEQAAIYVESGFLPESIKTAKQAVTIAMKGWELGVPPMQAFAHIHLIKGKPTISSELMLALIYSKVPGAVVNVVRSDETGCSIEARRPGAGSKLFTFTFDEKDATAAQLLSKDNWKKNPKAMYRARAISAMARIVFADAIMGCSYTPEELDTDIVLDDDGNPLEVEHRRIQDAQPVRTSAQAPTPPAAGPTKSEMGKRIRERMVALSMSDDELTEHVVQHFGKAVRELSIDELQKLLEFLNAAPAADGG